MTKHKKLQPANDVKKKVVSNFNFPLVFLQVHFEKLSPKDSPMNESINSNFENGDGKCSDSVLWEVDFVHMSGRGKPYQ